MSISWANLLPSIAWTYILQFVTALLSWDIVKGLMVAVLGLSLVYGVFQMLRGASQ